MSEIFNLPENFPQETYEATKMRLFENMQKSIDAYRHIHFAWKAVAYRYWTCYEHHQAFLESVEGVNTKTKDLPAFSKDAWGDDLDQYIQDREIFGFFTTGLACIESFCYALYATGTLLGDPTFPLNNPRTITPERTTDNFSMAFPGDPLTVRLQQMVGIPDPSNRKVRIAPDQTFTEWNQMRNILAHRSCVGRIHSTNVSGAAGVEWMILLHEADMPTLDPSKIHKLDETFTTIRFDWFEKILSTLIQEADDFTKRKL